MLAGDGTKGVEVGFIKKTFVVLGGLALLGAIVGKKDTDAVATTPSGATVTRASAQQNIMIGSFRWSKSGFGSVMEASFVVTNNNNFDVKDVEVRCEHYANSGTKIDSNTRTLYERIQAGGSLTMNNVNMGFIHNQAVSSRCAVTDFSKA